MELERNKDCRCRRGEKAGSSERFNGSPFLNYSCFGTKMRSGLWLFNPSERDSKWLLAPESELVV